MLLPAMSGEDLAGRSAEQQAARHRRRNPGSVFARAYERGAAGERATAAVLNPLSGDGWWVLHDLAVPGSDANIDHIVVGPTGIFVVDSKHWSGRAREGGGTLWVGRHPKGHDVATLLWESERVREALGRTCNLEPRAVISLTAAPPTRPVLRSGAVTAVAVGDLVRHLVNHPVTIRPEQAEMLARVLDRGLPSRSGAASSLVRPDPLPPVIRPPGPPARRPALEPSWRTSHPPARPPWRASPRSSVRASSPARRRLVRLGLIAFCALFGLAVLDSLLPHPVPAVTAPLLPVAPSTTVPATTAPPGPAPIAVRWSCPAGGDGWTATFPWPGSAAPAGTWQLQTGPGPNGPWRDEGTGTGPQPPTLHGLRTGEHGWARAGNPATLAAGGAPAVAGPVTVPAGC